MTFEWMALAAALCWAVGSLISAPASAHLGAFAFTRWRMTFASLLLWSVALYSGSWQTLPPDQLWLLAASGCIGILIGDTALFASMNRLGPRRAGVLFATHAGFSAWLAWWWLGEVLWGWALVGAVLLVAGVMLAIVWGKRSDEAHGWEQTRGGLMGGVALGLLAALCQSVATLMLKPLMSTGVDPVAASAVRMSMALAAHGVLWLLWSGARAQAAVRAQDLWLTFASAAVAMALGMTLILAAMREGQAGVVAILSSVTPILILPLLWLVYRRRPAWGAWIGAVLAVWGTALVIAPVA